MSSVGLRVGRRIKELLDVFGGVIDPAIQRVRTRRTHAELCVHTLACALLGDVIDDRHECEAVTRIGECKRHDAIDIDSVRSHVVGDITKCCVREQRRSVVEDVAREILGRHKDRTAKTIDHDRPCMCRSCEHKNRSKNRRAYQNVVHLTYPLFLFFLIFQLPLRWPSAGPEDRTVIFAAKRTTFAS